jgi:hypothetical protein
VNVLCCSVLRREIEEILRGDSLGVQPVFLDSMLHMHPEKLHRAMEEVLSHSPDQPCLLVYGQCHPFMADLEKRPHCCRTAALNCGELLLGHDAYRKIQSEEGFLFLPEWTDRWREVFQQELGFTNPDRAREFMQESRKSLIYLDTGLIPVPEPTLREIEAFFGMPVQVLPVSLDPLRAVIRSSLRDLERSPRDGS